MKAIILAAGKGTRLNKYTAALPKGMLEFQGKSLIKHQIDTLNSVGVNDICIVTGYEATKIQYKGVSYAHNPLFADTNMVESMFCARDFVDGELIVSYSDIIYEQKLLLGLINMEKDVIVAVDKDWQQYWKLRYDQVDFDLESLKLNEDGTIKELGDEKNATVDTIDGRYVGLLKFSAKGTSMLREIYDESKAKYMDKPWQVSGRVFQQAYMTDMLQEFLDRNIPIHAHMVSNGWLEFDTNDDYERMTALSKENKLEGIIDL